MKIENHTTSRLWFLLISNYNINQFINLITIDYYTILIIDYHWLVSLVSLVGHGSLCLFTCKNIRECCKLFFFHISSRPGSCHFKNLTSCPHFSASPKLSTLNMYNPCFPTPFFHPINPLLSASEYWIHFQMTACSKFPELPPFPLSSATDLQWNSIQTLPGLQTLSY